VEVLARPVSLKKKLSSRAQPRDLLFALSLLTFNCRLSTARRLNSNSSSKNAAFYLVGRTKREILFTVMADSLDEARPTISQRRQLRLRRSLHHQNRNRDIPSMTFSVMGRTSPESGCGASGRGNACSSWSLTGERTARMEIKAKPHPLCLKHKSPSSDLSKSSQGLLLYCSCLGSLSCDPSEQTSFESHWKSCDPPRSHLPSVIKSPLLLTAISRRRLEAHLWEFGA